jgi:hypothetical protein
VSFDRTRPLDIIERRVEAACFFLQPRSIASVRASFPPE